MKIRSASFNSCRFTLPALLVLLLLATLFPLEVGAVQAASVQAAPGQVTEISDYQVIRQPVRDAQGRLRLAIRSFRSDAIPHLLVLDPVSFESFDLPASTVAVWDGPAEAALAATPFMKALQRYDGPPYPLQNGGAIRAEAGVAGTFLTVDLCPSKRPFEREMFQALEGLGKGAPVPVAVAVTGVWLMSHPQELSYLKHASAAGKLAITWINHSYHHTYQPQVPLQRNFVLTPGTDFSAEVLDLERLLLARGLVPSPFFRFPGLVSDEATVRRLRELSLIPIGSDAWLAKGESPRPGSFILVHGNGNEPKGVQLLLPMLRSGELHLLPLATAFRR